MLASEKPEKTFGLHLRLIFGKESINKTLAKGEDLISGVNTLLDVNVQWSTKITRHVKKQESMTHSKGKSKSTETVPEKDPKAGLLAKDFKTVS